jgi:hypothetical protein
MNINSIGSSPAVQTLQRSAAPAPQAAPAKASEEARESSQARAQEASTNGGIDTYA